MHIARPGSAENPLSGAGREVGTGPCPRHPAVAWLDAQRGFCEPQGE